MSDDEDDSRVSENGSRSSEYPPPLIFEPTLEHKESWIVLHGRGDKARTFAEGFMGFLKMPLPDGRTLQQHLPHVRFVFPTASFRRARVFNRATITQWFDIYSWNSTEKTEWQVDGLKESTAWVSELVKKEIEAVGAPNVVVGGLSQGCATALTWNLLWTGEPIRCVFGMSGWLPFCHVLELFVPKNHTCSKEGSNTREDEDIFDRGTEETKSPYLAAIEALCQELGIAKVTSETGKNVPMLLAHGRADDKVDVEKGREARQCLRGLGCTVAWVEYEKLPHWFDGVELSMIARFVQKRDKNFKDDRNLSGEPTIVVVP